MSYKLIALDLDDTIVSEEGKISEKVKKSLKEATEKGVYVALVTGRPLGGMKHIAEELNLDKDKYFLAGYNGSQIVNPVNGETIYSKGITFEQTEKLYKFSKENNLALLSYKDDIIVATKENKYTDIERDLNRVNLKKVDNLLEELSPIIPKVIFAEENARLLEIQEKALKEFGEEMYVTFSKPFFLEFMNKNVDKGESILYLANMLGIKKEETIAAGDSYNDISMRKGAGLFIAMGNAVPELKEIADEVTLSIDEDGIAEVVAKYILN